MFFRGFLIVAALVAQPLVNEDVLEPSVENEVAHALSRAPDVAAVDAGRQAAVSPAEADFARLYATNGLSASAKAIALVSAQRADGRWLAGTNDVTRAAVWILNKLTGAEKNETRLPQ